MSKMIEIKCLNNSVTKEYPLGTSLQELIKDQQIKLEYPILGARINNEIEELTYEIFRPKIIEFIDMTNIDGMRMYIRSLWFVMMKAVKDIYPEAILEIKHSISNGFYCELENIGKPVDSQVVSDIENQMRKIIYNDLPFERKEIPSKEALKLFEENKFTEKVKLFKSTPELYTSVYFLDNQGDYFYGHLVPSTRYLTTFDLLDFYDGMLLRIPKRQNPDKMEEIVRQDKMYEIFKEYKDWAKILGISSIGSLNEAVMQKKASEIIKISEALHEKKVAQIADAIKKRENHVKIVLISGPSSSGKTTFAKRLAIQLKVAGLKPIQISLDNYFVDRELTPRDETGEYDFESLDALDIELFNENINDLMSGKEVNLPLFSFIEGKRFFDDNSLTFSPDNILLVEGIHALNPRLTHKIDNTIKFKIYVSALTTIGIDGHNRVPTTDNRLLRRIVRDYRYRNYSALETLERWTSVRKGEEHNIFPYQEEADLMFNSALLYELGVLKVHAEPLLKQITEIEYQYSEALRLLKFLAYFKPIHEDEIPPTSILREFLTGSSFKY